MGKAVVVLAGQSNASRISDEITIALNARFGAGNYILVETYAAGAPLTRERQHKPDWADPGELKAQLLDGIGDALSNTPGAYYAGTIWLQGEADTYDFSQADRYEPEFLSLFSNLHATLVEQIGSGKAGLGTARVIISDLSDHAPEAINRSNWAGIQNSFAELATNHTWVHRFDPDLIARAHHLDLNNIFDGSLHYSDSFSQMLADALVSGLTSVGFAPGNTYQGTNSQDDITGSSGADIVRTFGGQDRVFAGKGSDQVELGTGNDYVRVGGGVESFDGGSGRDYISYYDSKNGIRIDLRDDEVSGSWAVNDTIRSFESASGSKSGSDMMLGTSGTNTLRGYGGDDRLYGRGGSDKLYGGDGQDFLDGGTGEQVDYLYGGADADAFHFDRGEGIDIIKDFENNIDVIELDNFNFSNTSPFDYASQHGDDVIFDFGTDGHLTVENMTIGQLHNDLDVV